jgi:hypothetical protein
MKEILDSEDNKQLIKPSPSVFFPDFFIFEGATPHFSDVIAIQPVLNATRSLRYLPGYLT